MCPKKDDETGQLQVVFKRWVHEPGGERRGGICLSQRSQIREVATLTTWLVELKKRIGDLLYKRGGRAMKRATLFKAKKLGIEIPESLSTRTDSSRPSPQREH